MTVGYLYLIVKYADNCEGLDADDGGHFETERRMFDELGPTGWKLVGITESNAVTWKTFYFMKERA